MNTEKQDRSFGVGGYRGRIIFLGDGTEVLTDSEDTEMFDVADEDNDLESQVSKNKSTSTGNEEYSSYSSFIDSSKAGTTAAESQHESEFQSTTNEGNKAGRATATATERRENKKESKRATVSERKKE